MIEKISKLVEYGYQSRPIHEYYYYLCKDVFKTPVLFQLQKIKNVGEIAIPMYSNMKLMKALKHHYFFRKNIWNKNIDLRQNLKDEVQNYIHGFMNGYNDFTTSFKTDIKNVYAEIMLYDNSSLAEFEPVIINDNRSVEPNGWNKFGIRMGRYYAAWCIVLSRQINFEPLFEKRYNQSATEPQQKKEELIREEIYSNNAKNIFQKAIKAKLMGINGEKHYKWYNTKQLLAYFAQMMSNYLHLSNKIVYASGKKDKTGACTIDWKSFELLFNETRLRDAKNSWLKNKYDFHPTDYEKIDKLFIK